MDIKLINTLTRQKELFKPINQGKVGLYVCGPTVYNVATIGNFRSFMLGDTLRRTLEMNGFEVRHVMNITDVGHLVGDGDAGEDKMIIAMRREGKSAWEIAEHYTEIFLKDMERLNLKKPHVMPRATEHIAQQIEMIQEIEKNGYAYKISDGIYFDTSKLKDYGALAHQDLAEKQEGARVVKNPEKRNPADFALWKFSPKDEKREMEWDSPWGKGFPGWHIECSAMSEEYLDSPFDVHTGGEDHISTHHPNEIAQTQAARGNGLANFWLHGAFLKVDNGKMSKSKQNVYTIDDVISHGFEPLALRYFYLGAHYRSSLNFTWDSIAAAQNALNNVRAAVWHLGSDLGAADEQVITRFKKHVNDDLDTPGALAVMWELIKSRDIENSTKLATLAEIDKVFGLEIAGSRKRPQDVPEQVREYLKEREQARAKKDWDASDAIRKKIEAEGFEINDGPDGQHIHPKL